MKSFITSILVQILDTYRICSGVKSGDRKQVALGQLSRIKFLCQLLSDFNVHVRLRFGLHL